MYKANGRERPAKREELANLKGKHFKCSKCGDYTIQRSVEFGSSVKCDNCGSAMTELSSTGRKPHR